MGPHPLRGNELQVWRKVCGIYHCWKVAVKTKWINRSRWCRYLTIDCKQLPLVLIYNVFDAAWHQFLRAVSIGIEQNQAIADVGRGPCVDGVIVGITSPQPDLGLRDARCQILRNTLIAVWIMGHRIDCFSFSKGIVKDDFALFESRGAIGA
jgi:hypothetical protein